MRTKILTIFFLLLAIGFKNADAQEATDYSTENIFGINLNTNGGLIGGLMYRHSKEIKNGRYLNLGVELVNVKHPNEVRFSSSSNGNVYVFGKKNYMFALRPQIGYEFVLFTKGKEDGIQVDAIFNAGPSICIKKPYYIQYLEGNIINIIPYQASLDDASIIGSGGFFHGFDKIKFVPGIHCKTGISFEFSGSGGGISGVEIGSLLEAFPQTIDILDVSDAYPTYNRWLFSSLYLTIFFGSRQ